MGQVERKHRRQTTPQALLHRQLQTGFALPPGFRSPAGSRETEAERRGDRFREVTVSGALPQTCGSAGSGAGPWRGRHGPRLAAAVAGLPRPGAAVAAAERAARQPALPEPAGHGGRASPRRGAAAGSRQVWGPVTWAGPGPSREREPRGVWPCTGSWLQGRVAPSEPLAKLPDPPRSRFQVGELEGRGLKLLPELSGSFALKLRDPSSVPSTHSVGDRRGFPCVVP